MSGKTRTQQARAALEQAEKALEEAVASDYPVGTRTQYRHGENWIPCVVVGHASYGGDRVKVRGLVSEKEYWVCSSRLEGASNYT